MRAYPPNKLHQRRVDRIEHHESPVEHAARFIEPVTDDVVHELDGNLEQRILRQVACVRSL